MVNRSPIPPGIRSDRIRNQGTCRFRTAAGLPSDRSWAMSWGLELS